MATIVQAVKVFGEGLTTSRAKIALMSVRHLAMFMSFWVSTQRAFHGSASRRFLLLSYQSHISLTHYHIVYDEDKDIVLQHFGQCLQNPTQIAHWDLRKVRKDGSVLWVKEIIRIVTSSDGSQVARIVCEDITERKLTEAALLRAKLAEAAKLELEQEIASRKQAEAMVRAALEREKELSDLKSRFITTASHEFRTPLTTILSSSELLERYSPKLSEEKKLSHLKRIQVAVKQMTGLLDDILLIGKAEAGKLEFNPLALDLVKFCRDLVEEMEGSALS